MVLTSILIVSVCALVCGKLALISLLVCFCLLLILALVDLQVAAVFELIEYMPCLAPLKASCLCDISNAHAGLLELSAVLLHVLKQIGSL